MTLCIARKIKGSLELASDSRISFGNEGHIDFGIKVFSVPVKIYFPTSESGEKELFKYFNIGMYIAGSTTNAYIVKESIYEILQNLQFIQALTNYSMIGICEVVKKVFQKTSQDICAILRDHGIAGLIITGNCPEMNKIRTFKFTLNNSTFPIQAEYDEILIEDGIEFMGSGQEIATVLYDKNRTWNTLKIIKEAINSNKDRSIGGGLQYGKFNTENNFYILGVKDYELDDEGYPNHKLLLRGVDIYKEEFETSDSDFHISYTFADPFIKEIDKILEEKDSEQALRMLLK